MGSSPKTDTSPGMAQPQPGTTPPPAAPPLITAGFPPNPNYQGYAGQPFDPAAEVYASFLPKSPTASATGLDQNMLNAIMGISPGAPAKKPVTDDPAQQDPRSQLAELIPQLAAPTEGSMRGSFQQIAQSVADQANKAATLDAYLTGRDQLAKLSQLGRYRRPGESPQRGSGPGYGSSGPGGVGMGAGRTA